MPTEVTADRVITFFKALGAGIAVLAMLVARVWHPGAGEVLGDTTKSDWILLCATFGTLIVLIAFLVAMK